MNPTINGHLYIPWLILALVNLAVQVLYFFNDHSRFFFLGKKITTPFLLFGALAVVIAETGRFPVVAGPVLLAMGLGEIGIEGSSVVQKTTSRNSWSATVAGILFLLVNLYIGCVLLLKFRNERGLSVAILAGITAVAILNIVIVRLFKPVPSERNRIFAYSSGLAILASGAAASLFFGMNPLGNAALILTISDSLVLLRMGASWDKSSTKGFRILLIILLVILLLYYLYIALLIRLTGQGS